MSRRTIEGSYARLRGIRDSSVSGLDCLPKDFGDDYVSILNELRSEVDDEFTGFDLGNINYDESLTQYYYSKLSLLSKINQLITYLETVHRASNRIVELGSVYNLIKDVELKSRCSDLLSAADHFDRVINQATQVLEERIRVKLPELSADSGLALVGKAINNNPEKTRLRFSDQGAEQEGFAAIFRGLVGAFRNPSHHRFLTGVSREQALQICAFIDNMLSALEKADIIDQP